MVYYPTLSAEMARRGITKKELSESIGICCRSLNNKLTGRVPFTWPEVCSINERFFPGMSKDDLFARPDQQDSA